MAVQARSYLEVESVGHVTVVRLLDKQILGTAHINEIGAQLYGLVEEFGRRKLLINFEAVQQCSTFLLGKLANLYRKLQAVQGHLALCAIHPNVSDGVQLCLGWIIPIHADEQEGLQSFQ